MTRPPTLRDLSLRESLGVLAALVAVSAFLRDLQARGVKSPWVFPDELIYASLARSVAQTGQLAIRGVHTTAYSIVYPLLLSPSFLGGDPSSQYAAAKWTNAIVMSLAAVPAFLLARRLLPNVLALLTAALALLVPSMAYTGLLMTENAFYPVFLFSLLAIVRVLESPSAARQIVALGTIGFAFLTRAQAVVFVPILVLAIVIAGLAGAGRDRSVFWPDVRRALRAFWPTAACLAGALVAVLSVEAARGKSPAGIFGHYADQVHGYPLASIPKWFLYHLVDLELYLGILPFVPATIAAAALLWRASTDARKRAFAATAVAAVVCTLLLAATVSSEPELQAHGPGGYPPLAQRLHERYAFYVAVLYLILFLYWLYRRSEFSTRLLAPLLVVGACLPLALPYGHLLTNASFEALALVPWNNSLIAARHVPVAMAVTAAVLSPLLFVRRGSIVMLQVGLVAVFLWFVGFAAIRNMGSNSTHVPSSWVDVPSWVDRAVPPGAHVAVVWAPEPRWSAKDYLFRQGALWRAELFNDSITSFYYLSSEMDYSLPESQARLRRGRLILPPGSAPFRYVLVASHLRLAGDPIALDVQAGLTLYRLSRPADVTPS